MRASIYARESSDDKSKAPPIEEQIERAKQYAIDNDYQIIETYSDNGYSGGDWKRPAWNKLKNDAKRHLFKIVIVWNQDRIARDTEQFLNFYRTMKESHVEVYSITEGKITMETLGDRVKHTSMAQAAEIFRLLTSDKVKKAYSLKKAQAEKNNKKIEWGRKPKDLDIQNIIALRKQGKGYRQISQELGAISYQTIRRVLQKYLPENDEISNKNLMKNHGVTD